MTDSVSSPLPFALPSWRAGLAAGVATGFAVALVAAAAARAKRETPRTVPHVDLRRYAGRWFEIARLPNRFQQQCDRDVAVQYTLRPDGRVAVENQCVREDGTIDRATAVAKLAVRDGSNAKLKVRFAPAPLGFLPFVWGDYWILDLAPDYSWAIVGGPSREFLWLLARTPSLSSPLYYNLLRKAALEGFDTSQVVRTRQTGA